MKHPILARLALGLPLSLSLSLSFGASLAYAAVHIECNVERGKCPLPPVPPAPPAPPAAPPAPHAQAMPAPPAPPALPAIDLPAVPAAAHAACSGKHDGSRASLTLRPGETMDGVCEEEDGKMVFQLRSYRRAD